MHKLRIYISYKILIFLNIFSFKIIGNRWEEGMPQWVECPWTGGAHNRTTITHTNRTPRCRILLQQTCGW